MPILVALWFYSVSTIQAHELPPSRLSPDHKIIEGRWEHLRSYCENWSFDEKVNYEKKLSNNLFSEFLYINSWDAKFMQSQVSQETPQRPYLFCQRDIYFEPHSVGTKIQLKYPEVQIRNCDVSSHFVAKSYENLELSFKFESQNLEIKILNYGSCPNGPKSNWVSVYRPREFL
jgi:hypothetical protein